MCMISKLVLLLLGAVTTVVASSGIPSQEPPVLGLSSTNYTSLRHAAFPHHGVRVKKSHFCDGTVDAYTGYIDIEARHLFFYFFESRRDPAHDDVVFWTNGGPGGSSSAGLLMELGPCRIDGPASVTFNPHSWNAAANIFFIDQPIGVGFSYADHGEFVSTTEEAAKDIAAFVAIFFHHFSKFQGRGFHMAGESYGGRYVPVYASAIYDQSAKMIEAGLQPINLKSIMIANGCTDFSTMLPSYYEITCTSKTLPPVLSISECVQMKRGMQRCVDWYKAECLDRMDHINCKVATDYCFSLTQTPYAKTGLNNYDMTMPCPNGGLCYEEIDHIEKYLNRPEIQQVLGTDSTVSNFTGVSMSVLTTFEDGLDFVFPTTHYLTALLERGVKVLLFVGVNDWACNWLGNEQMSLDVEWTGQKEFASQPLTEWYAGDHAAGLVRKFGGFTFATVFGAGHMAPYDKPMESLEILKRWLYEDGM